MTSVVPNDECFLDYAATSAIRPEAVAAAVSEYLLHCGATPGRGGHPRSLDASRMAFRCRRAVAEVLGIPGDPGRIAFLSNATHALNTALWGLLSPGDVLVLTAFEHNAVLRPADALARERDVEVRMIPGRPDGTLDLDVARTMMSGARLLAVNAVSNVLGTALPVTELAGIAREEGTLVLVDAAQSAGHLSVSHAEQGADVIAFTGHKGLLGPQGTGGLWVREGVEIRPLLCGGTGGDSTRREMPDAMPDHLEAGTGNAPGLAGLLAGCAHVLEVGVDALHDEEIRLKSRLRAGLAEIPGVTVHSPDTPDGVGIVTFTIDDLEPGTVSDRLVREWGVAGRSGLHCAPESHRVLGTLETGAVRFSVGWATTDAHVDRAIEAVSAVAGRRALQQ